MRLYLPIFIILEIKNWGNCKAQEYTGSHVLLAIRVMTSCRLWKIPLHTSERIRVSKTNTVLVFLGKQFKSCRPWKGS